MNPRKHTVQVLQVCSEIFPYLKTGGLADVTAALSRALSKQGCDVRMLVPGFPDFINTITDKKLVAGFPPVFGARSVQLFYGSLPETGLPVYVIEAPGLYDRPGNPYNDTHGQSYTDNHRRFALLGWMAARLVEGADFYWRPDIVHGHDWHAGLAFAYIKALEQEKKEKLAGTLFTIHNMAYQGNFPAHVFSELHLPAEFYHSEGLEFYDQVSFLKSGLVYADRITTVSPTYAHEIQSGEQSCGLGGMVQKRGSDLHGILNGIDTEIWNPATDSALRATYNSRSITGKKQCRLALQQEMGLSTQNAFPVFCVVSRFASQKGLDLVLGGMNLILQQGGQVIIIGNGEQRLESAFSDFAYQYPKEIAVRIGYNELLAHRVIAGSDIILIPSRYEPCGLTQFYGLRYGTLPLVHEVGGLADSVTDTNDRTLQYKTATGFSFKHFDQASFDEAIRRAFHLFPNSNEWRSVQREGMKQQFDWRCPAQKYKKLYLEIKNG